MSNIVLTMLYENIKIQFLTVNTHPQRFKKMANPDKPYDDHIGLRINNVVKGDFLLKCGKLKKDHAEMIRNLISAFNEGRLTITPTKEEQELLS